MNETPVVHADSKLTEGLLRIFALFVYPIGLMPIAIAWWRDTSRWTLLLLLLIEGFGLLMVLLARRATRRDLSPVAVIATAYVAIYIFLFSAAGTTRLVPEVTGVTLQFTGLLWQFAAKVALGRSFGLLPASRGLVVSGPYRLVRHPIYLGYLISHIGFLLANFSWRNFAVLAVLYVAQVVRLRREESHLSSSDEYRRYCQRVRWRLLPFVF